MKELRQLQNELLERITHQREYYGNIDPELLYQYDKLSEHIRKLSRRRIRR